MCEKIQNIISKAIDLDQKSQNVSRDLQAIADDLNLPAPHLHQAVATIQSQTNIVTIDQDSDKVKETLLEYINFKNQNFCIVKNNPQQIQTNNLYLQIVHKRLSPFYSGPFYDLCLKSNETGSSELSWKLNHEKYLESVFLTNSLLALLSIILTAFGVVQFAPIIVLNIGVIYWSRYKSADTFHKLISTDLQSIKLSCELKSNSPKQIE